jgi:hypothetical protein
MTRRFLFPLATSVVGLLAISPVLAGAEQSTPAANKAPAKSTTTSSPDNSGAGNGSGADTGSDPSGPPDSGSPDSGSPDSGTTGSSGKGSTATTGSGPGGGSGGGARSSSVCDPPETNQGPAPQTGDAPQTHEAGEAGSVDVERLSDTELRVVKATPNDGWTEQVATPSGPRITVKFTRQGQSPSLMRFAASMDQKGTMIHVRVTSCG